MDARTHDGFRRNHADCNHCHGPDGIGSTFGPYLVDGLPGVDAFRRAVLDGRISATSATQGFAVDDIYAYLQARADGRLGRGCVARILNRTLT